MSTLQETNVKQIEKFHSPPHKRMVATLIEYGWDRWAQHPLLDEIFNGMIT